MALCSGSCRRTPMTNFQHLWRQTSLYCSRDKFQAPSSPHTATRLPDNLDRMFQRFYASKCSTIITVSIYPTTRLVATYASPHASTCKQPSPRGGDVGASHMRFFPEWPGQRPHLALWQNVGSGRQGHHWLAPANCRGFPPPGESRLKLDSLSTASTPCAGRTQVPLCSVPKFTSY
jgi:hypothetical protein